MDLISFVDSSDFLSMIGFESIRVHLVLSVLQHIKVLSSMSFPDVSLRLVLFTFINSSSFVFSLRFFLYFGLYNYCVEVHCRNAHLVY